MFDTHVQISGVTFLAVIARVAWRTDALSGGRLTLGSVQAVAPLLAVLASVALGTRCDTHTDTRSGDNVTK